MYSTIPIHWNIKSASASPGQAEVVLGQLSMYLASWLTPPFLNNLSSVQLSYLHSYGSVYTVTMFLREKSYKLKLPIDMFVAI
jgi:hypothetical protein